MRAAIGVRFILLYSVISSLLMLLILILTLLIMVTMLARAVLNIQFDFVFGRITHLFVYAY